MHIYTSTPSEAKRACRKIGHIVHPTMVAFERENYDKPIGRCLLFRFSHGHSLSAGISLTPALS